MNEEELKKEIEKWSRGCNVNIDFPKGLKYCDGINLCKVCKTNLDLYEAELKGFQKGKLEERERFGRIIHDLEDDIFNMSSLGMLSYMNVITRIKQLQKEIRDEKQDDTK